MILEKIHTYLKNHSVQDLLNAVWVASSTYYDFVNETSDRTFSKNILDKFYKFFDEKPDEYYEKRLRKIVKSENIISCFLKFKRMEKNFSIEQVSKALKCSGRQIANIEKNGVKNQYLDIICGMKDLYEMSYDEKFELDTLIGASRKVENRINILNEKLEKRNLK